MRYIVKSPKTSRVQSTRFYYDNEKGDTKKAAGWVSSHRKTFETLWYWTNFNNADGTLEMVLTVRARGYMQVIGSPEELAGFVLLHYPKELVQFTCSNELRGKFYELLGTWQPVDYDSLQMGDTVRFDAPEARVTGAARTNGHTFIGTVAMSPAFDLVVNISNDYPSTEYYGIHHFNTDARWFNSAGLKNIERLVRKERS